MLIRLYAFRRLYLHISRVVLRPGRCGIETSYYHPCPGIDLTADNREVLLQHSDTPGTVRHSLRDIPVSPDGRIITHVFQNHNIHCFQGDIATVPALMKEVLGNQNDPDIPVMAAFRK